MSTSNTAVTNWANLFLLESTIVREASSCIAALSELRRHGHMHFYFGPFRSYAAADLAMLSDDPSDDGMSVEQIDWTGFYEVGGWEPAE